MSHYGYSRRAKFRLQNALNRALLHQVIVWWEQVGYADVGAGQALSSTGICVFHPEPLETASAFEAMFSIKKSGFWVRQPNMSRGRPS
jgi:hypothetical protein